MAGQHVPATIPVRAQDDEIHDLKLPAEQNIDAAQVNMVSPQAAHVDGKVWTQNNGCGNPSVDVAPQGETWSPSSALAVSRTTLRRHPGLQNNAWFTDFRWRHIGRIDAKTGEVKLYETPATAKLTARAAA